VPAGGPPAPDRPLGEGTPKKNPAPDGSKRKTGAPAEGASQSAASGTPRDNGSRQAVQAIAGLLEQAPRPGAGEPAAANYGGRA
jgi:hypothetical protein